MPDAPEFGDVTIEHRERAVVVVPDVEERRGREILRRQEEHRLEAQLVLVLRPVRLGIERDADTVESSAHPAVYLNLMSPFTSTVSIMQA